MEKATVIVIGGGATGVGILRDLAMRGIDALLIEKRDLMNGASSRFHGLLHSGGRYAVKDHEAARECTMENEILRRIGKSCIELTGGMFVRFAGDDEAYEEAWVKGCKESDTSAEPITMQRAFEIVPRLSKTAQSAYIVQDASIDGFRLAWQNVDSAKRYGGRIRTYAELVGILQSNGVVKGVRVKNTITGRTEEIACDLLINATGGWAGEVASLAGLEVRVQPDKGALMVFSRRLTNTIVNRLHKSSDGDIFVPHGSATIYGTTSISVDDPEDTEVSTDEVEHLLSIGETMIENLRDCRLLRVFAGIRPLYIPPGGEAGRGASRGFAIIDHGTQDGLQNIYTIIGGKLTTYRLMAEKMTDVIASRLGNKMPCRTAIEPLVEEVAEEDKIFLRKLYSLAGAERAADRLGKERTHNVVERIKSDSAKGKIICECENVTRAEIEEIASESTSQNMTDVRRRTRMGMGTCQGAFCSLRSAEAVERYGYMGSDISGVNQMRTFIESRWRGIRPVLFGKALNHAEMTRSLYELTFNVNGGEDHAKI